MKQLERGMALLEPSERDSTTEMMTSWKREGLHEGMQRGLHQGKEEVLAIMLEQRFSTLPAAITARLDELTSDQLNALAAAIFQFNSLADLEDWLARQ
jgi:flagellar biosynthesis/type III secretory pathway protein FliH